MSKSRNEYATYTPELIADLKRISKGLSRADAVKAVAMRLNLSPRQGRAVFAKYVEKVVVSNPEQRNVGAPEEVPTSKGAHIKFNGDVGEIDLVTDSPRSLEQLLNVCGVDLNVWEVEKYVVNKWEMGRANKQVNLTWTDGRADGYVRDGGGLTKAPLYQVKAWLRRKVEASTLHQMLEKFTQDAVKFAPKTFKYTKPNQTKADCCYVLNIQDLHLAKLSCGIETGGANWDIKIAEQTYRDTVNELIDKAPIERIEEIVMIVGSDMLQVDNDKSTTTAGTYVDSDTRLSKAFDVATHMLTTVIEELASRFKVRCVVFGGNHDRTISLFLGRYVEAWFRNHENVNVDASPRSRKYYGYGKTLIAFDHGDEIKSKDLPLVIMRENQATISNYRFIECLTGHFHSEQSEDMKGIVVRVAPALCSPDRWHSAKGFIGSIRRSQGLLYQRDEGLECIIYSRALD